MDGLLPMMFKAIKKSKTRRRYECLSSRAAQSYSVADFYSHGNYGQEYNSVYATHSDEKVMEEGYSHRRHKSVGDFYFGYGGTRGGDGIGSTSPPPVGKQLVRFRSHRLFSCVTGAS